MKNDRNPNRRSRRITTAALAALVSVGAVAGTIPAASAATRVPDPVVAPRAVDPPGRDQLGWDPASAIANGVVGKLGGDGIELLLHEIGVKTDTTGAKLDALTSQITALSGQLNAAESRMTALANTHNFGTRYAIVFNDKNTITDAVRDLGDVGELAKQVTAATKAAQDAKGTPQEQATAAKLATVKQDFDTKRATFIEDAKGISTHRGNIRDNITPSRAESLIDSYRAVLRDNRYLSSADTTKLEQVYVDLENLEAAAALVEGEANAALYSPENALIFNHRLATTFDAEKTAQRAGLPARIPAGTVVDVGEHDTGASNKTIWMLDSGYYTWFPDATNGAPGRLKDINDHKASGPDWKIPAPVDMNELFAGVGAYKAGHPGSQGAEYLTSIGLPGYNNDDHIWTTDTVEQAVGYKSDSTHSWEPEYFHPHVVINVNIAPGGQPHPVLNNQPEDRVHKWYHEEMRRWVDGEYRAAGGRLVVMRTTGDTHYM